MGKRDKKKKKGAEKTALKTEKKISVKMKKELALKGEEDIEELLAMFTAEDNKKNSVVEETVPPPSKRSAFSLTSHPDKEQLILFGGEYFNGSKTCMYNDLFLYSPKTNKWTQIISPGGPLPRSSHQAVALSQFGGQLWIFGGEFTSPSQSQFYHNKELWVFHFTSKIWEKIIGSGNGPSSRSGHRMVGVKKQLVIFGGFHDNLRNYKYFNDVYIFNLETYSWKEIDVSGMGPCPRSGCQVLPMSDGKILVYGGYSKEKVKKDIDKGIIHSDIYILQPDKHDETGLKWKWQTVKQHGAKPSPRCAFSMTPIGEDKAVLFGGVFDIDKNEEELEGTFYNDLFVLDLLKATWHEVHLMARKELDGAKKSRRRNKDEDGEQIEDNKDKVNEKLMKLKVTEKVISDDGVFTVMVGPSSSCGNEVSLGAGPQGSSPELFRPPPRINPGLAFKRGVLYLYGGMFEEDTRQLTLNDFYSLDMNKLDEWNTIIPLNPEDLEWFDSESDDDSTSSSCEDIEEDMDVN